ncbi:hypothetical protein [Candidatus Amarobacter glycogenicus]|uniref:hypothetical protein n=1 Tax=Candidatus Amarobacter glycogenicus TaxID=3140699 RepID=UPI002A0E48C7|nr:hypothetical protein [Dehalococcoidia bacterium]
MSKSLKVFAFLIVMLMLLAACGGSATTSEPATAVPPAATEAVAAAETATRNPPPTLPAQLRRHRLLFDPVWPVEEQEKFRAILQEGGFDVTSSEEGPMLDPVLAGAESGKGEIDVIGAARLFSTPGA